MHIITNDINEILALSIAEYYHRNQKRKYTEAAYVEHCEEVALLVSLVPHKPEMILAALLHDTKEDTNIPENLILAVFGKVTDHLVDELTHRSASSDGNRQSRKRMDREFLAQCSPNAKTIKLADIIDNCRSIEKYDPPFAKIFLPEMQALIPCLKEGNESLYDAACKVMARCGYPIKE